MSIEMVDVHKAFGAKKVLRGLSIEVGAGQTLSLIGFSGAGKSTILKHVVGLMSPDRGSVRVDGREVPKLARDDLYELRREIGYVFQFAALFDSMTIAENISMGLRKRGGMTEAQIAERVADSLARVDLEGYERRFPSELSGGQKKRAGLARAMAFRPRYLLYDEPTSGLDPVTTTIIDRLIRKMQSDLGTTSPGDHARHGERVPHQRPHRHAVRGAGGGGGDAGRDPPLREPDRARVRRRGSRS